MHTSKWGGLASRNRDKKKRYYEKVKNICDAKISDI